MLKKRLFGMMALLVGVMLVFAMIGCDNGTTPDNGNGNGNGNGDGGGSSGNIVTADGEVWVNDDGNGVGLVFKGGKAYTGMDNDGVWEMYEVGTYSTSSIIMQNTYTYTASGNSLTLKFTYQGTTSTYGTYTKQSGQTVNLN